MFLTDPLYVPVLSEVLPVVTEEDGDGDGELPFFSVDDGDGDGLVFIELLLFDVLAVLLLVYRKIPASAPPQPTTIMASIPTTQIQVFEDLAGGCIENCGAAVFQLDWVSVGMTIGWLRWVDCA